MISNIFTKTLTIIFLIGIFQFPCKAGKLNYTSIISPSIDSSAISSIEQLFERIEKLSDNDSDLKIELCREVIGMAAIGEFKSERAKAYYLLGKTLAETNKYNEALLNLKSALLIAKSIKNDNLLGNIYFQLGAVQESKFELDSALTNFSISHSLRNQSTDTLNIAESFTRIGMVYWLKGNFDVALKNFKEALQLREVMNAKEEISGSLNNIGSVYWKVGDYKNALQNFLASFEIRKQIADTYGMTISLNNIGIIYQKLQYYDIANKYYNRAKLISDSLDYKFGISYSIYNLGLLKQDENEILSSTDYFNKSLELSSANNFRNLSTMTKIHVGYNYEKLNDFTRAITLYKDAKESAIKIDDKFALASSYQNLARILVKTGDLSNAQKYVNESQQIAIEENLKEIIKNNYYIKFEIQSQKNNVVEALEYYKQYSELNDSILNESLVNNINNMLIRVEIEQTEYENKLLKQDNLLAEAKLRNQTNLRNYVVLVAILSIVVIITISLLYRIKNKSAKEIEKQNQQLEALNNTLNERNDALEKMVHTRDKLFTIIAHDLRNPLSIILNYTGLLKNSIDELDTEEFREYVQIINKSGESLSELINNLLNWARNQMEEITVSIETFSLNALIKDVVATSSSFAESKRIQIILEFHREFMVEADRNMIEVVIRNLISNALKFSFPDSEVIILLESLENHCKVSISDMGTGIDKTTGESLFKGFSGTKKGTNNEKGSGIGLSLSRDFVIKNNGELNFYSEEGKGTTMWFTIPLANVPASHLFSATIS